MATLPEAPSRDDFPDQESFEEALGFWQSRVGRIHGLVARAGSAAASDPPGRTSGALADKGT
jgi:hypothetical protein